MDILDKLRELERLQIGSPIPGWIGSNWGIGIAEMCREAADEIEELRRVAGRVPVKAASPLGEYEEAILAREALEGVSEVDHG